MCDTRNEYIICMIHANVRVTALLRKSCLYGTICTYNMELRLEYVNMVQYVRIICVTQEMKIHTHDIYIFTHMNHVCIDKACLM